MARVLLGTYMVRFPLGGMLSWPLQWMLGCRRLGHDVHLVERASYPAACYDPIANRMSDDCSHGMAVVADLLARHGLVGRWCYVDAANRHYGMSPTQVRRLFSSADVFVDLGTQGAWLEEAQDAGLRVLVDGEPGYTQMKMQRSRTAVDSGYDLLDSGSYDCYYTNGHNVGTAASSAPTAGRQWRGVFNPVVVDLFPFAPGPHDAPFTTLMNWRAHDPLEFEGRLYGQKDQELRRFIGLPAMTDVPLELSVSGPAVPVRELRRHGWRVASGLEVGSFDSFRDYIQASRGEFTVAKHVFVATRSGWFSDRSAAYLASGRPVVMQDTGFGDHLPCGEGLFAVRTVQEAAAALEEIAVGWWRHAAAARQIAIEHLDAERVLGRFFGELGLS
jgi:hypothetical protein